MARLGHKYPEFFFEISFPLNIVLTDKVACTGTVEDLSSLEQRTQISKENFNLKKTLFPMIPRGINNEIPKQCEYMWYNAI